MRLPRAKIFRYRFQKGKHYRVSITVTGNYHHRNYNETGSPIDVIHFFGRNKELVLPTPPWIRLCRWSILITQTTRITTVLMWFVLRNKKTVYG